MVPFAIERLNDDGEVIGVDQFHATMPTDERLFLITAMIGDEENMAGSATALLDLLREALPPEEFRVFRSRFADPEDVDLDMDVLQDIVSTIMQEWTDFPTGPSSASSTSPTSTGSKSTGRVRGAGSIRSNSPSPAS